MLKFVALVALALSLNANAVTRNYTCEHIADNAIHTMAIEYTTASINVVFDGVRQIGFTNNEDAVKFTKLAFPKSDIMFVLQRELGAEAPSAIRGDFSNVNVYEDGSAVYAPARSLSSEYHCKKVK